MALTTSLDESRQSDELAAVLSAARNQRLAVWCGPVMVVILFTGLWGIARFIPPPAPSYGAQRIADIYQSRPNWILLGLVVTALGAGLLAPWFMAISLQMRRIEGRFGMLALTQAALGTLLVFEFQVPLVFMITVAFRPDAPIGVIQAFNDFSWILFIGFTYTALLQVAVIAIAILGDRRADPVFPRWAGYFNLLIVVAWTPCTFIVFFKTGPLAWNGVMTFWVSVIAWFTWTMVMTRLLLRAVDQQEAEELAAPSVMASTHSRW